MILSVRHFQSVRRAIWVCVFFVTALLQGQAQGKEEGNDYEIRYLGFDEGLPDRNVRSICHDRNGAVWVGTLSGLFRYDGRAFEAFEIRAQEAVNSLPRSTTVEQVLQDSEGNIWVFSPAQLFALSPDLKICRRTNAFSVGCLDWQGRLLAWNDSAQLQNLRLRLDSPAPRIEKNPRRDFSGQPFPFDQGRQVAFYEPESGQFSVWENEKTRRFSAFLAKKRHLRVLNLGRGAVFEHTLPRLWYWDEAARKFQYFADTPSDLTNNPYALRWAINRFLSQNPGSPLAQFIGNVSVPNCIEPDRHGNLWVATNCGIFIFKFRGSGFRHFDALRRCSMRAILGQGDTLHAFGNDTIRSLDLKTGKLLGQHRVGAGVRILLPWDENSLLVAGEFPKFLKMNARQLAQPLLPFLENVNHHFSALRDHRGRVWLGCHAPGVWQLDTTMPKFRGRVFNLEKFEIFTLTEDHRGQIWAGGMTGLFKISGDSCSVNRLPASISSPNFTASLVLGDSLWLATRGQGLWCFDLRREQFVRQFTTADGLPNNGLNCLLPDAQGHIWLSTNRGLSRFDPKTGGFLNFGRTEGVENEEFNMSSAFRDPRTGWLYFGGLNGLTYFNPEDIEKNRSVPAVFLSKVVLPGAADGQLQTIFPQLNAPERLELSPEARFVEFHLASTDFFAPAQNRFFYQLEGFDPGWMAAGENPLVRYTNLDAGDYVFRFKTVSPGGESSAERQIQLRVGQIFYKTWWFRLALASLFGGIIWAFVQAREQRLREIYEVRRGIASDLHDDVAASLNFLAMQIKSLLARPTDPGGDKKVPAEKLERMDAAAEDSLGKLSDIVWAVDTRRQTLGDLAKRLRDHASDFLWENNVPVQFDLQLDRPEAILNARVRQHVLLIVKEAVNNIVRHTASEQAKILLENRSGGLFVSVENLFRETRTPRISGGKGLENMQNRAQQINGKLEVERGEGFFKISLRLPNIN